MENTPLTYLDQEIRREKQAHSNRMAKLKQKAAAEQRRVDAKVIALLKEDHFELHQKLERDAHNLLLTERKQRSKRAKAGDLDETLPHGEAAQLGRIHNTEDSRSWT